MAIPYGDEPMVERTASLASGIDRIVRFAGPVGWIVITPIALLAISQVLGLASWRFLAVLHALTPYLLAPAIPMAALAIWRRHWGLGVTATAVTVVLVALSWPLVFSPGQRSAAASAAPLRITHSNVLYENERLDDAVETILSSESDLLVITEYTPRVHDAFEASPLGARWPHRIDHSQDSPGGTAVWSRYPISPRSAPDTKFATVIVDVTLPDRSTVRVVGAHAPTPTHDFDRWRDELADLARFARSGIPTVVVGDLNASWWHPDFRDLLAAGLRDAHQVSGAGFSVSWPTGMTIPPFVRLDHALVDEQLVVDAVADFDVPGSDHRGFDVTIRRVARDD